MSRRPVPVILASAVLSSAALSACGTGLEAQIYKSRTPQDSTSATAGDIALRNLAVEAPTVGGALLTGGRAVVTGTFVNNGSEADALTGASSEVAASVLVRGGVAGDPQERVAIPALGTSGTSWSLELTGLTQDLRPGTYLRLTLVFEHAGRVTVQVPIRTGDNGLGDREAEQDPYEG